jgi:hypothetical protein
MPTPLALVPAPQATDSGSERYTAYSAMSQLLRISQSLVASDWTSLCGRWVDRDGNYARTQLQWISRQYNAEITRPYNGFDDDSTVWETVSRAMRSIVPDAEVPTLRAGALSEACRLFVVLAQHWQSEGPDSLHQMLRRSDRENVLYAHVNLGAVRLLGAMRLCNMRFRAGDAYMVLPIDELAAVFLLGETMIAVSLGGVVVQIRNYETDTGEWMFEAVQVSHVSRSGFVLRSMYAEAIKTIFAMTAGYASRSGGRTAFGARGFLTTPLSRRAGMTKQWFLRIFGANDFGPTVREYAPPLARNWREGLHAEMRRVGLNPPAPRVRTRPWDWSRIPAAVAEIMQRDLTLHLDEPTEVRR